MTQSDLACEVLTELNLSGIRNGALRSAHEGYAVILEELDELWEEVRKKNRTTRNVSAMRREAIQVAAMAMRFVLDVCERGEE